MSNAAKIGKADMKGGFKMILVALAAAFVLVALQGFFVVRNRRQMEATAATNPIRVEELHLARWAYTRGYMDGVKQMIGANTKQPMDYESGLSNFMAEAAAEIR